MADDKTTSDESTDGKEETSLIEKKKKTFFDCKYLLEPIIFLVFAAVTTKPAILAQFVSNYYKDIRLEHLNTSHPINVMKVIHGNSFLFGSFSYIADRVPLEERIPRIVVAEVIMILVSSMYSILVGVWIDKTGFLQPCFGMLAIYTFSLIYTFIIPESLVVSPDVTKAKSFFRKEHFRTVYDVFFQSGLRGKILRICSASFFLYFAAFSGKLMPLLLRIQSPPLKWKAVRIGVFSGVSSALYTVSALILLITLGRRLSLISLAIVGMTSCCLSNFVQSFVLYDWVIYLSIFIGSGSLIGFSVMRGYLSILVTNKQQGALFSGASILDTCAELLGGLVLNQIFAHTAFIFPGLTFLIAGVIVLIAIGIAVIARRLEIGHEEEIMIIEYD
ncbi:DgyrCDS2022 [Dimorphilus gyrociliatus]|uniref:DgyrCDS2022 n=1 Tax=Dimorphilus gyrociliatus TaxID=2664684 RepID=A0A7I8VBU5_9ANNE|nr:DgyrCDS2022 [Dimorphilus gyrociliatus]